MTDEELNRYLTDVEIAVSASDHHFPKAEPARPSFLTIVAELDRLRTENVALTAKLLMFAPMIKKAIAEAAEDL